ncbi:MAG: proteasome accessory factor PafA2 family protein, partial [Candidatus Aenigmarchaeota archaeon]|nr:proteasome accessory factor PafA2 family protein [Candidatus Aenigmarchaeota archaeon]MDI6721915.1 proteasome accessory factor PafA2 family protein [Candidatus Aenigmarchaeota archaeon]
MERIYGIETEYGTSSHILIDKEDSVAHESIVERMVNEYCAKECLSGFMVNGGRFYIDHGHPEYATPETSDPRKAALYEKAGERIVSRALSGVKMYKNNEDSFGNYYGCHENYGVRRDKFHVVTKHIIPFLATRQIFTGAGKYYMENGKWRFRISQRSLFRHGIPIFSVPKGVYAYNDYERFEVTCGDSNMSETATMLKIGATACVIDLIENDICPHVDIRNVTEVFESLLVDEGYRFYVELSDGRTITAIDAQRIYLDAARKYLDDKYGIFSLWGSTLDDLERNYYSAKHLDWPMKKLIVESALDSDWPQECKNI